MSEDDVARLEKAALKSGLSPEGARTFAAALAKELDRERLGMEAKFAALQAEMEKMELRLTIKGGVMLVVAVGVLALIMKL